MSAGNTINLKSVEAVFDYAVEASSVVPIKVAPIAALLTNDGTDSFLKITFSAPLGGTTSFSDDDPASVAMADFTFTGELDDPVFDGAIDDADSTLVIKLGAGATIAPGSSFNLVEEPETLDSDLVVKAAKDLTVKTSVSGAYLTSTDTLVVLFSGAYSGSVPAGECDADQLIVLNSGAKMDEGLGDTTKAQCSALAADSTHMVITLGTGATAVKGGCMMLPLMALAIDITVSVSSLLANA